MNTWKVILATLVIFGAGVITGGLLVTYSNGVLRPADTLPAAANMPSIAGSSVSGTNRDSRRRLPLKLPLRKNFLEKLDCQLDLTAEQRRRIERIISTGQERTEELWETVEPQIHQELMETKERIRAELTPEQQARFAELVKRRPPRPPPPPCEEPSAAAPPLCPTVTNPPPASSGANPPPSNP